MLRKDYKAYKQKKEEIIRKKKEDDHNISEEPR
jgi:hypothetical protein